MARTQEMSGTVTQWLKPKQPLALWWQQHYPGLRQVSRELAARLLATRTAEATTEGSAGPESSDAPAIPIDTPGLRYYDYGLLGGAIDYRMRMEFTLRWGGDPNRSAFTRAWGGKTGSLAHSACALLSDCAPVLGRARPDVAALTTSLPALAALLEEYAGRVAELAPWDWSGEY